MTIQPPLLTTSASSIALSGTTSGGSGLVQVSWSTNQGAGGTAHRIFKLDDRRDSFERGTKRDYRDGDRFEAEPGVAERDGDQSTAEAARGQCDVWDAVKPAGDATSEPRHGRQYSAAIDNHTVPGDDNGGHVSKLDRDQRHGARQRWEWRR